MMRKISLVLLLAVISVALTGCYYTLDRKGSEPERRRAPVRKRAAGQKKAESADPAFDLIFKRNPQQHENSLMSDAEQDFIRKDQRDDADGVRKIRKERLQENTKQKDWVFGTKGGKYF